MRVTEAEIKRHIHQSNLIEGYDIPEYDAQSLVAWRYLVDVADGRLDHHCIQKVQKIITLLQTDLRPDWRGYYRKIPVWVGGRETPAPERVPALMDGWIFKLSENHLKPQPMHIDFEHIHPFVDGNGRTGRMLMWWMQMRRDEPLTKITHADRQSYYGWFK